MKLAHSSCISFLSVVAISLSGCAEMNSIHRQSGFPAAGVGKVITVDAKQRHMVLAPEFDAVGNPKTGWRICAEAAPDVFSALASSGSLSISASANPSGEGAFSIAETAAVIQRTQTINLLRESFYRTCERYASGAITKTQFVIQAARDQRSMVSVLAIEQLTGAVRPPSTIISGPSTTASVLSGAQAASLIKDYVERRDAELAKRDVAKQNLETAQGSGGVCPAGDSQDLAKCTALQATLTGAEEDLKKAQGGLDDVVKLAKDLSSSALASTAGGTNSTGGITQAEIGSANLAAVSQAIVAISNAATINEPLMFCIAFLSDPAETTLGRIDPNSQKQVINSCLEMIKQQQALDNVASIQMASFRPSAKESKLAAYLSPGLTSAVRKKRLAMAQQAAVSAGLDGSSAGIIRLLAEGPEDARQKVIDQLKILEKDPLALKSLD